MGYRIEFLGPGLILLALYIVIDFVRNRTTNLVKRLVFYSFLFYVINVLQHAFGGINIPPLPQRRDYYQGHFTLVQPYPFYFVREFIQLVQTRGFSLSLLRTLRLTFFNLLFLAPLGFYLPWHFKVKSTLRIVGITALVSLGIEITQVITTITSLTFYRTFNVDDLILNTLGAYLLYLCFKWFERAGYNKIKERFLR